MHIISTLPARKKSFSKCFQVCNGVHYRRLAVTLFSRTLSSSLSKSRKSAFTLSSSRYLDSYPVLLLARSTCFGTCFLFHLLAFQSSSSCAPRDLDVSKWNKKHVPKHVECARRRTGYESSRYWHCIDIVSSEWTFRECMIAVCLSCANP